MADKFGGADSLTAPATDAVAVVPHDSNPIANVPKALYVGGAGDITMRGVGGSSDTLGKSVPAGSILPFRATIVRATGTTATAILALY
jgi:hypothetical protein